MELRVKKILNTQYIKVMRRFGLTRGFRHCSHLKYHEIKTRRKISIE
jgi:hypothetical protein